MTRLSDIGEFEAIRQILASRKPGSGVAFAGDDAAILSPSVGMHLAATTDAFVEGVHYRPGDLTDHELGVRFAAANLSDLAATAARPRWGLISMGVRPDTDVASVVDRDRGVSEALRIHGAALVGGNLSAVRGPEWMSLALIGECDPGRAWTRRGARPGDLIAVTGYPGRATAGLRMRVHEARTAAHGDWWEPLYRAYATPDSRVGTALALAATGAVTAAIDISDGLAADLGHLCEASGVGAELGETDWPGDPLLARAATACGADLMEFRLGPGDDYELLLTLVPSARDAALAAAREVGVPFAIVGRCTPGAGITWIDRSGSRRDVSRGGYDHYR